MDDKIDKNTIKNLPTEIARKEASTWIKKLILKSQHSPPALNKNGGFDKGSSTDTTKDDAAPAHSSRQRKSADGNERAGVARRASRSISPASPGRESAAHATADGPKRASTTTRFRNKK